MVFVYTYRVTLWEKTSNALQFKHFLIQKRNPCKCELLDSDPFFYFKQSYDNNNLVNFIQLEEGLEDLEPLSNLQERQDFRKMIIYNLYYALFIFLYCVFIVTYAILFSEQDPDKFMPFIYVMVFLMIPTFIFVCFQFYKVSTINSKIREHFQRLNTEKYNRKGLEWVLDSGNCCFPNNVIILRKLQNQV